MLNKENQKKYSSFRRFCLFYVIAIVYLPFAGSSCVRKELIPIRNQIVGSISEKAKKRYHKLFDMEEDDEAKKNLEEEINSFKNKDALEEFINEKYKKNKEQYEEKQIAKDAHAIERQDNIKALEIKALMKNLNKDDKKNIYKLPDDARQEVLKNLIKQKASPAAYKEATGIRPAAYEQTKDIGQLIQEKVQEQQEKGDDIPKDSWGPKLPLKGDERNQFLLLITPFNQQDLKYLKGLFNEADPESIKNFFAVFFTGFEKKEERIELVATMIYLYKGWPKDTIQLCNDPNSLSIFDKLSLWKRTKSNQCELLTKLESLLSAL